MLSWIAVQLERGAIERDLQHRSVALLHATGHGWASVAFSGRDGLLIGHPADLRVAEDAASKVRDVWGVRTVETRVAAEGSAATPAAVDGQIVPLPEQKPRQTPVVDANTERAHVAMTEEHSRVAVAAVPLERSVDIATQAPTELARSHDETEAAAPDATERQYLPPAPRDEVSSEELPDTTVVSAPAPQANSEAAQSAPAPDEPAVATQTAAQPPAAPPPPAAQADVPPATPTPPAVAAAEPTYTKPAPLPEPKAAAQAPPPPPTTQADTPSATSPPALAAPELADSQPAPLPVPKTAEHDPPPPLPQSKTPAAGPQPPLPEPAPRFETAALPPGNIAADTACLGDVRLAANGVEVHFARGDAKLDAAGKAVIDKLVGALTACPQAALRISGHTDATGHRRRNQALSQRRARAVAGYMAHKGIDAGRLAAVGYGETRPVAPNDTGANRARNRRIEVLITARAGSLPPMPVRKQGARNGLSRR